MPKINNSKLCLTNSTIHKHLFIGHYKNFPCESNHLSSHIMKASDEIIMGRHLKSYYQMEKKEGKPMRCALR